MKVCHITSGHNYDDVRIFQKECVSLAKGGYEVYLIAVGESSFQDGVNIIGIGEPTKSRLKRMMVTTKKAYKEAVDVDAQIYHFHDPELLPYGLRLKRDGKKVIFDSHENYKAQILEKKYIPQMLRKVIAFLYRTYESYVVKHFDAVIIPCTIGGVNIFDNIAKKTVYIDNLPVMSELTDRYQERNFVDCKSICYVGGLTYNRGITHLIKAADKAGVKLILAGNFMPSSYGDEVKKMPQYQNVDYKGYLNRNDVINIYKECAIGICTILNVGQYNMGDNFATKVYEYMSSGLPVIISESAHAKRVLKEYEFGLCVPPDDIEAISEAINYLLNNPDIAKEMGESGRRAVLERYNWDIEEEKLLFLYEELSEKGT